ncbi:MAG: IPT/TIG domain-containing protein, partial [Steroidobacteraceae bacterium]
MPRPTHMFFLFAMSAAAAAMGATTYPQPLPSGFSPKSGPPGTVITVTGSGFTGLTQVWIGEAHNSTVYVVSDSLVKVTVPTDATTAHLGFINPQ